MIRTKVQMYLRWRCRRLLVYHSALQLYAFFLRLFFLAPFSILPLLFYATRAKQRYKNLFYFSRSLLYCLGNKNNWLTLSFFLRSGVMKPFFAFLALLASSSRARTSALFLSVSACFLFFS